MQRTAELDEAPEAVPQPRRRGWLVAVAAIVVVACAAGVWLLLRGASPPTKTVVTVTSDPSGAKVAVNGVDTGRVTPAQIDVPDGSAALPSVTLTSPGHRPVTAQLTSDDVKKGSLLLRMEALPPPKPQPPVQAQPPPAVQTPAQAPAVQPPPEPTVRVTMTGDYPFEVLEGSRVVSAEATTHAFAVKGKPRLRIRNATYFLDQPVQVDGSRAFEWTAPGLGKLFLTAPPLCTVAIGGRSLGESPIQETMAAGTYTAEVTCDGQVKRQTFSIAADATSKVAIKK